MNGPQAFRDTSIGGMAYLRNIVHLPFYLQNAGLRKVNVAQQLAAAGKYIFFRKSVSEITRILVRFFYQSC